MRKIACQKLAAEAANARSGARLRALGLRAGKTVNPDAVSVIAGSLLSVPVAPAPALGAD
jgi:hypothetical protein